MIVCHLYNKSASEYSKLSNELFVMCKNYLQAEKLIEINNHCGSAFDPCTVKFNFSHWVNRKLTEAVFAADDDDKPLIIMSTDYAKNFNAAIRLMGVFDYKVNIAKSLVV